MKVYECVVLAVVVLAAVVAQASALQCYQCTDCKTNYSTPKECLGDMNVCMKITVGEQVHRACGEKLGCNLSKLEHGATDAWNKIKSLFNIDSDATPPKVSCCSSDGCNPAAAPGLHPALALLPPALLLLLLRR